MKAVYMLVFVALATIYISNSIMAEESTKKPQTTYMGVDGNDPEAVAKRQKELGHEKWKELFGEEVDIDHVDFSPNFNEDHFTEGVKKVKDALKNLLGLFGRKPSTPSNEESNNKSS